MSTNTRTLTRSQAAQCSNEKMVHRYDSSRIFRRLPSTPSESKVFQHLARLSVDTVLPTIVCNDGDMTRPALLVMDDSGGATRPSRHSWSPGTRASLSPVLSAQRRQLSVEEDAEELFETGATCLCSDGYPESAPARTLQYSLQHRRSYKNKKSTRPPAKTTTQRRTYYLQRSSVAHRESDGGSYRNQISSSFDSSYASLVESSQKPLQGPLIKPRSVATLRPPVQRMSSLQSPDSFENSDERKSTKSHPSTTNNSPSLNARKGSGGSSQKVTRRPRSTDAIKMPQTGGGNGGNAAGGGGGGAGARNGTPSAQRSPAVSTPRLSGISANSQSIILFCMDNARSDIALRILQRMAHKRDDFALFYANLNNEQSAELVVALKKFLSDIVKNIGNPEKIREISSEYGVEQAYKRSWGFKADFFAVLADALTTECVFLDGAAHQPTETIEAWASLVELMFTHVRDGYYQQIRQLRRNLQNFSSPSNVSSQSDQSFDGDTMQQSFQQRYIPASPQSVSTTNSDSLSESNTPKFPQQSATPLQSGFLRS